MGSVPSPSLSSSSSASGGTVGPVSYGPITIGTPGGISSTIIFAALGAVVVLFALFRKKTP